MVYFNKLPRLRPPVDETLRKRCAVYFSFECLATLQNFGGRAGIQCVIFGGSFACLVRARLFIGFICQWFR